MEVGVIYQIILEEMVDLEAEEEQLILHQAGHLVEVVILLTQVLHKEIMEVPVVILLQYMVKEVEVVLEDLEALYQVVEEQVE
jgi:hypothetical protein